MVHGDGVCGPLFVYLPIMPVSLAPFPQPTYPAAQIISVFQEADIHRGFPYNSTRYLYQANYRLSRKKKAETVQAEWPDCQ